MKREYLMLIVLLIIPTVCANGLVLSNSSLEINKTYGSDFVTNLTLTNTEPMTFFNISFEDNPYVRMPKITELTSGQSVVIPLTIFYNENANTPIRIKGYYYSNVGIKNELHEVIVTPYASTPCTFSITRGDTVKWTSNIVNTINLKEYPSGTPVDGSTLTVNTSFSRLYNEIGSKKYQWFVGSWGFEQLCTIDILSESGYINDPQLDGLLTLNIVNKFESTNLTAQIFKTNYTMSFYDGDEGTVFITNTGDKAAKNIQLNGDWFTFNTNNFDLNPGYSKSVTYTIVPIITSTNDTNKTYNKSFTISGNFPTITQDFNIFVNYADISTNASQNNRSDFLQWVCSNYPELCQPKIVYRYVTNGSGSATLNITSDQWRDYNLDLQNEKAARQTLYNIIKQKDAEYSNSSGMSSQQIAALNTKLDAMIKENQDNADNQRLAWILLASFIIIGGMVAIGRMIYYKKNKESGW